MASPTPSSKRSIQDIIPPARSRPIRPTAPIIRVEDPSPPPPATPPPPISRPPLTPEPMEFESEPRSGMKKFIYIFAAAFLIVGAGIVVASTMFHRAYVTVTPQTFTAAVQGTFTIAPDSSILAYEKVTAEATESKSVTATGSADVSDRSSGTVTVYNAYSTSAQRLITGTRLATSNGLVYRTRAPITVPGYTMKAGVKVPGAVETVAYADEAGSKYNIGLTDFTLPAFKDTDQDRYTLIYARSKTSMTGGFVGKKAIVEPGVRAAGIQELKEKLAVTLKEKIKTSAQRGTIVFPSTVEVTYTEAPDEADNGAATLSVSGFAVAPGFNEAQLASVLAREANLSYEGSAHITNPDALTVSLGSNGSVGAGNQLSMEVKGSAALTAVVDASKLAQDFAGKSKSEATAMQATYPGIADMNAKIYPFWLGSFPADPLKISIEIAAGGANSEPVDGN